MKNLIKKILNDETYFEISMIVIIVLLTFISYAIYLLFN